MTRRRPPPISPEARAERAPPPPAERVDIRTDRARQLELSEEDRELLRLAGKAAGLEVKFWQEIHPLLPEEAFARSAGTSSTCWPRWSPLSDDGDALRLAVKCGIDISFNDAAQCVYAGESMEPFNRNPDICAAARRAIVRAAAEIGKAKGE